MINLDDNNQPVSPEIGKIRIKDFSDMSYTADDDKDFHIRTVRDETLIDSAGELNDSHEFALNMFDRGNASDLPDSDTLSVHSWPNGDGRCCLVPERLSQHSGHCIYSPGCAALGQNAILSPRLFLPLRSFAYTCENAVQS